VWSLRAVLAGWEAALAAGDRCRGRCWQEELYASTLLESPPAAAFVRTAVPRTGMAVWPPLASLGRQSPLGSPRLAAPGRAASGGELPSSHGFPAAGNRRPPARPSVHRWLKRGRVRSFAGVRDGQAGRAVLHRARDRRSR
jgi:hypothetical protein